MVAQIEAISRFLSKKIGSRARVMGLDGQRLYGETISVNELSRAARAQLAGHMNTSLNLPGKMVLLDQAASVMLAYLTYSDGARIDDAMDAGLLQLTGIWDFRSGLLRQKILVYEERPFVTLSISLDTSRVRKSKMAEWKAISDSLFNFLGQ